MLSSIIFIWWSPIKNFLLSARFMSAPVFDLIWAGRSSLRICIGITKLYISRFVNGLSFFTGILLNIYFFKVNIIVKKKTSVKAEFIKGFKFFNPKVSRAPIPFGDHCFRVIRDLSDFISFPEVRNDSYLSSRKEI